MNDEFVDFPTDADYTDSTPPELSDEFDERTNWHLRLYGYWTNRRERTAASYAHEINRLHDRRELALNRIDRRIAWHRDPLVTLHAAVLARNPKLKTVELPAGTLKARTTTTAKVHIGDADVLLAWAEVSAPGLVGYGKPRVFAAELNRAVHVVVCDDGSTVVCLASTGELVPGVTVTPAGTTTFAIDTEGEL